MQINTRVLSFRKQTKENLEFFLLENKLKKNQNTNNDQIYSLFDCLPHDLTVAKLQAYGFSMGSLKLVDH